MAEAHASPASEFLHELGDLWDAPDLARHVPVKPSGRMTRMLGCYDLRKREIRVAAWILEGAEVLDSLRREVFCHEAAHAVVHQRHGRVSRPHGAEWRALMEQAGFAARVRIPGVVPPPAARRNGKTWEHRCPACDRARIMRSRQRRLRCRRCIEAGRSGALVITRH